MKSCFFAVLLCSAPTALGATCEEDVIYDSTCKEFGERYNMECEGLYESLHYQCCPQCDPCGWGRI